MTVLPSDIFYIGCAIDPCWRLGTADACSAYVLLACFFCGRFSAVASCGNAAGLCSGVCLETFANPGNHGDSVVLLDRIEHVAPLVRIQKCWLSGHQNMQKPFYTDVSDQNIDNIYLCTLCRSTEIWLYSII